MEPDGIVALAIAIGLPVWLAIEDLIHRFRPVRQPRRSPARAAARRVLAEPRAA